MADHAVADAVPVEQRTEAGDAVRQPSAPVIPRRQPRSPGPGYFWRAPPDAAGQPAGSAGWVASQAEGNRNAGLFWAANRALDADPAADLGPLAAAARQVGLGDREITRTLDSARRTGQPRPSGPDYQAEAGDQA